VVTLRKPVRAAAAILAAVVVVAACGGDGDRTARDYIPELSGQGLALLEQGRDPFAPETVDVWRAHYQSNDGRAAIVLVYVEADEATAAIQYATLAEALRHPPPEFFGANAEQVETDVIALGDEQRAFVTATADNAGNLVWTDIYRSGAAIAIIQLLAAGEDATEARQSIARAVLD
jgi:hypothetical protein